MPIHIILGKPGSGKSMYATQQVIKELAEGTRNVVTNLPLRPDKLNEYLQKRYPNQDCRMVQRLRVLTDDEMREFWKYRGPQPVDALSAATGDAEGVDVEGKCGVAYFLDEAHIAFNARDWATLGRGAIHYMSQHRKLGDIVWPITQSPGNLDKQFRSVAEDFTVLRNEYTAKLGVFRGRGRFVRRTYLSEPTGNAEPFETASFQLDTAGVAACYDTARGIGVHGSKADIGRRAKGIPIWTVIPMACVLALSCVALPYLMGKGVNKVVQGTGAKMEDTAKKIKSGMPGSGEKREPRVMTPAEAGVKVTTPKKAARPDFSGEFQGVTVAGVSWAGKDALVQLSDGRTLRTGDGYGLKVGSNFVELGDGTRIWKRSGRIERTGNVPVRHLHVETKSVSPRSQELAVR